MGLLKREFSYILFFLNLGSGYMNVFMDKKKKHENKKYGPGEKKTIG